MQFGGDLRNSQTNKLAVSLVDSEWARRYRCKYKQRVSKRFSYTQTIDGGEDKRGKGKRKREKRKGKKGCSEMLIVQTCVL